MASNKITTITGTIINDEKTLNFSEICHAVQSDSSLILQLIEYQVIEPTGEAEEDWQFDYICLKRARLARNFYHELEVNLPGIALIVEMMEKISELESKLARFEE